MGIPAFYCIRNGVSNKSTNIPSSRCLICFLWFFFFIISFVLIASGLFWFRGIWSLFLSGKHTRTVVHNKQHNQPLSFQLWVFFHLPHHKWLDPGRVFGMHLQPGRDSIQAACFLLAFFLPSSIFWFTTRKRRTRSNARRSAKSETETFGFSISPELSFSFCFIPSA